MKTNHGCDRNRYTSAQTRAGYQQQDKKSCATSKSGKKPDIFKQIISGIAIIIISGLLTKVMISSVPVKRAEHVIVPGDTISAILNDIAAQVEEENNLTRLTSSMFAETTLLNDNVIIYPGEVLVIEVRVTPLGVITRTGVVDYHLIGRKH